jgi:hypothetical protein
MEEVQQRRSLKGKLKFMLIYSSLIRGLSAAYLALHFIACYVPADELHFVDFIFLYSRAVCSNPWFWELFFPLWILLLLSTVVV